MARELRFVETMPIDLNANGAVERLLRLVSPPRIGDGERGLRQDVVRAGLQTAIPLPFVVAAWGHGDGVFLQVGSILALAVFASLLVFAASRIRSRSMRSLVLPYVGLLAVLPIVWTAIVSNPAFFFLFVTLAGCCHRIFRWSALPLVARRDRDRSGDEDRGLFGASAVAVFTWLMAALFGALRSEAHVASIGLFVMVGSVLARGGVWMVRRGLPRTLRGGLLYGSHGLTLFLVGLVWFTRASLADVLSVAVIFPLAVVLLCPLRDPSGKGGIDWTTPVVDHPERLLIATFTALILLGTILLLQPACSARDGEISLVDAAFTSVSAVCVTGLIVLDTPVDFSVLGQVTILLLIQLGGIGMMAFSATAMRVLGRRLSLRHEAAMSKLVVGNDRSRLFRTARTILLFTVLVEFAGTIVLGLCFHGTGDPVPRAIWRGLFTSVSAFCNAGFALQSDSLVSYRTVPAVLHTVGMLIVLGGLSPVLALSLPSVCLRRGRGLGLQGRLALLGTMALLLAGFLFVGAVEWNRSLAGLGWDDRLHNAWFQSVTLRTAGFNSVDMAELHPATLALMMLWMFIGGCPGGTAGGIKVTTAFVLLLAVRAAIRGETEVAGGGRRVAHGTVHKAMAISAIGAGVVLVAYLALQLTQRLPESMALFEIFSALGTVGLSTGATARLDGVGKGIVMLCMFAGRVGPITLFMILRERRLGSNMSRPEEQVEVG